MTSALPDQNGYWNQFGGRFVPETLMGALDELEEAYQTFRSDASFQESINLLLSDYVGRPTPLYYARRLSEETGSSSQPTSTSA